MKKIFALALSAAVLLTSCKYSNSSRSSEIHSAPFDVSLLEVETLEDPNVTIDLFWSYERNIAAGDIYMGEAIEAFEKKYGGKVTVNEIGWNKGIEVMQRNLAGGDVSDLMFVEGTVNFPKYALYNYVMPVTKYIQKDLGSKWLDEASMDNFKFKGEYYGFSNYVVNQPYIIAYVESAFKDAGLQTPAELYENGQWTWDKFLEYVDFFTKDTDKDGKIDQWGLGPRYKNQNFGYASGAVAVIEKGDGVLESNFDTAEMREYFKFISNLQKLQSRADSNNGWLGSGGIMYSEAGLAQMGIKEVDGQKKVEDDRDFVPLPTIDGSMATTPVWDTALCIPNGSKNPQGAAVLAAMIMETKERRINEENKNIYKPSQLSRYEKMMTSIVPQRKGDDIYTGVHTAYGDAEALAGSPAVTVIETYRGVIKGEVDAFNEKLKKLQK